MLTHRFGRKIKLPATVVIKHQISTLMARDEIAKAKAKFVDQSVRQLSLDEAKIKSPE